MARYSAILSDVQYSTIQIDSGDILNKFVTIGVVVAMVRNEEHVLYPRHTVGTIQFKFAEDISQNVNLSKINFATPLELGIEEYPLIGESIIIYRMPTYKANSEKYFYSRRVNLNNNLQYSTFPNILEVLTARNRSKDLSTSVELRRAGGPAGTAEEPIEQISEPNYLPKENLYPLKSFDGDILFQNRYGVSIRMGSSQLEDALNQKTVRKENKLILGPTNKYRNDAILVVRVGQRDDPNASLSSKLTPPLTMEDINLDSSCFVMSENQSINFDFSTNFPTLDVLSKTKYRASVSDETGVDKSVLSGNQSILNSGRVVLNSKENDILLSARQDIILGSSENVVIDSGKNIYINPEDGLVFVGTTHDLNSAVKYNELKKILSQIKLCLDMLANRPGPIPPLPSVSNMVQRMNLSTIKSETIKIGN